MSKAVTDVCLVCGLFKVLNHHIIKNNQIYALCSQKCIEKLKTVNSNICSWCKREIHSIIKYLPNFGNGFNVLCSEDCLKKFDKTNEPASRCFQCKSSEKLRTSQTLYYWQTMELCSLKCVSQLQSDWCQICTQCKTTVPASSLGKYSVRFGNDIKQFCLASCLEKYKKSLRVCSFCQMNLQG